jgi:hypothetical protein
LRRSFADSIGKAEFTLTVNEKVIILMVPTSTGSQLYYLTFDQGSNLQEVIQIKEAAKKLMVVEGN